jgi:hypothetical protein
MHIEQISDQAMTWVAVVFLFWLGGVSAFAIAWQATIELIDVVRKRLEK